MSLRRRAERRFNELDIEQLDQSDRLWLDMGCLPPSGKFRDSPLQTLDDLREAWEENRDTLMALAHGSSMLGDHDYGRLPGTLPGCWWRFESQEYGTLRIVGSKPIVAGITWSLPGVKVGDIVGHEHIYEVEAEYMERHGLLTDEERPLVKPQRQQDISLVAKRLADKAYAIEHGEDKNSRIEI